ncbi:MAG: Rieske 2Fe-2S domain-containing protein [Kordiimonadaceae bacterium]|jgi:phthalate 4,5-dioxygenase|nr:Rieske 2Fe-2S domain-containing protein [Kordiimonadaceae bacterium]MBT6033666.1 Rieske 2Fe-2S domain-containing protein [Kordiimonadaceae bacterium]
MRAEDNELLTRVGPGTPMGNLMREYWFPIIKSEEVSTDGSPLRFRLLGEDLLAFRDSDGNVGIIEPYCPHRRAELFYGRNEECGIRCVYHGWKFDVNGNCVDMPSEPEETNFKHKVKIKSYAAKEKIGMIWVYMGDKSPLPELPDFDSMRLPEDKLSIRIALRECNYLQALEGDIDTAHLGFLHLGSVGASNFDKKSGENYLSQNKAPKYKVKNTQSGTMYGAYRDAEDDTYYWRVARFCMPCWTMPPGGNLLDHIIVRAWIPIDDHNSMFVSLSQKGGKPLDNLKGGAKLKGIGMGLNYEENPGSGFLDRWKLKETRANDYMIDREEQRTETYTGVKGIHLQDQMITESMGSVSDRTGEHLGTSDQMITMTRRRLINAANELAKDGSVPSGANNPNIFHLIRSGGMIINRELNWEDEVQVRKDTAVWPQGADV